MPFPEHKIFVLVNDVFGQALEMCQICYTYVKSGHDSFPEGLKTKYKDLFTKKYQLNYESPLMFANS